MCLQKKFCCKCSALLSKTWYCFNTSLGNVVNFVSKVLPFERNLFVKKKKKKKEKTTFVCMFDTFVNHKQLQIDTINYIHQKEYFILNNI